MSMYRHNIQINTHREPLSTKKQQEVTFLIPMDPHTH